jgi:hypothetical protein
VEGDEDAVAFDDFIDAIDQAQVIDRPSVRAITAEQFNTKCIVNDVILALKVACAAANIETKDPL